MSCRCDYNEDEDMGEMEDDRRRRMSIWDYPVPDPSDIGAMMEAIEQDAREIEEFGL